MSEHAAAVAYLMPPPASFWFWRDDGRDLAWGSGETIAFRQEVLAVVERLAPTGLPPFTAILLLLAATRDNWTASAARLAAHAEKLSLPGGGDPTSAVGVTLRAIGHRLGSDTANLINSLNAVAALPADLRHPLGAKAVVAEMVFENAEPAVLPAIAAQVVDELRCGADPATFDLGRPNGTALRDLIATIDALKLSHIDADRLRLRLRTGLDQKPAPPVEDLGPSKRVHHLLGEMADDPELGGLSRLARRLLAAVQVQRSLHRHEEMPTGGVADITNRGQLDRLLISELASDDLTLAVRVAVNEALYLQRESPPHQPPRRRVMLIDSGIRTWGVPRVYAAAVALALAATGDELGELATFRPDGSSIVPIDLTTREGLLSHLEVLDPRPHFAAALPAFTAEVLKESEQAESFLITQEDVLDDAEFRWALRQQNRLIAYAATVARDGTFRLWSLSPAGRSLVRQATLDLDQILEPPKRPAPLPLIEPTGNLPVILSMNRFPLLLPPGYSPLRIITNDAGVRVAITRDRQLMVWRNKTQGARILADDMPAGRLDLFRFTNNDQTIVAVHTNNHVPRCVLSVADLDGGPRTLSLLGIDEPIRGVVLHEETVFVICMTKAHAYSLHSAEPVASLNVPSQHWLWNHGRIFWGKKMLALSSSKELVLQHLPFIDGKQPDAFELDGWGPLFMLPNGEIRMYDSRQAVVVRAMDGPVQFQGVTADGRGVVAYAWMQKQLWVVLLGNGGWEKTREFQHSLTRCHCQQPIIAEHRYQLRKRFEGALVGANGQLLLHVRGTGLLQMKLTGSDLRLVAPGFVLHEPDSALRTFVQTSSQKGAGYTLRTVSWGGSRVYLDSRGMLHLKSANTSIPEITIVLNSDGPLAGWSSDGRVYGPKFFHGSDTSHHPKHLDDLIRRFTEQLR